MSCLKRTPLVHEDQRLTHFASLLQRRINNAFCGGAGASVVKWSNFLFVDQDDPSITPARGYWTRKYPTIQSAVNAAQSGDVIYINPGTYIEDLDISNIADNITIMGSGTLATVIQNATAVATITCQPTITLTGLTFRELSITNTGNDPALAVNCSAALDSFDGLTGALILDEIQIKSFNKKGFSAVFMYLNVLLADSISVFTLIGGCLFDMVGSLYVQDSRLSGLNVLDYDTTDLAPPSNGRDKMLFKNTSVDGLIALANQLYIEFNAGCDISGFAGGVSQVGDTDELSPRIDFHGKIGNVNLTYIGDSEAYKNRVIANFDDAIIVEEFIFNSNDDNLTQWTVQARNAVFETPLWNTIKCCANLGAGARGELDMLGADFRLGALSLDNYAVDRTFHFIENKIISDGAGTTITFLPPFIHEASNYTVHPEFLEGNGSYTNIEVGVKQTSQFHCIAGVPVTANFKLIMFIIEPANPEV